MRVAHLTSVHPRFDTRIFHKQCVSLAKYGFEVKLLVADGLGDDVVKNIEIIDVGIERGRIKRLLITAKAIYRKALSLDAEIYHIHDPELMLIGLRLKRYGKKVIFDAHEDFHKQLLNKPYLFRFLRKPLALLAEKVESRLCREFSAIVTATPYIRDKFQYHSDKVADINNFPILGEMTFSPRNESSLTSLCYVGGISAARGLSEMIASLDYVPPSVRLKIAGNFDDSALYSELQEYQSWDKVDVLGFLNRDGVESVYQNSFAGLVVLQPIPNYLDALPVKMFEYMSAGLPVIASNFDLWREIIEHNQCGICIDPANPKQIAQAINYLHQNPEVALAMGRNGQVAIRQKYNWQSEESKLIKLYEELLIET